MERNGAVTMETDNPRKVKIELVSKSTKDCWTADFRNIETPPSFSAQLNVIRSIQFTVSKSANTTVGVPQFQEKTQLVLRISIFWVELPKQSVKGVVDRLRND